MSPVLRLGNTHGRYVIICVSISAGQSHECKKGSDVADILTRKCELLKQIPEISEHSKCRFENGNANLLTPTAPITR